MQYFLPIVQQLMFFVILAITIFVVVLRVSQIRKNILLGKSFNRSDRSSERWKMVLLIAFGQKKMFDRPVVGLLHLAVYGGFLLINVEMLEIVLDGLLGTHRLFAPFLGGLYFWLISFFELLALSVVFACAVFLLRRNLFKIKRFWSAEMTEFPRTDANVILITEIVLMTCLYTMNATDSVLQMRGDEHYPAVGRFLVSGLFVPLFSQMETGTVFFIERIAWWVHIVGILGFAVYVTFSKHLHIALAFPTVFYSNLQAKGKFANMEVVTQEVKLAMGLMQESEAKDFGIEQFGAKDVKDLTWKNLLDAYSCTECGRCTSVCPANQTGKKLSPRKVMMDTRDRLEEMGEMINTYGKEYDDGKSLYGDYITKEEILACTTCNACAEVCPINIDPLNIIVQIRNHIAMDESGTPAQWNSMFANIENNAAPWAFSPSDRFNWAEELQKQN